MERIEASVCLLFLVFAWWKMRQQSQDKKMEFQRRQRRKLMLAARRKRAIQRRAIRLQRMQSRQQWMQMVNVLFYSVVNLYLVVDVEKTNILLAYHILLANIIKVRC